MSELGVALVSLVFVALPLALFFWALGRTVRHTAEAGSSLYGALGTLLVVAGFIALFWMQLQVHRRALQDPSASRWDVATGPLIVIALGLLVCVGAQIMRAVQKPSAREVPEWSRETRA